MQIENCKRFNVLVGDNGIGKTALLEAIFLTLAGNTEVSVRLKSQRGFDAAFSGAPRSIEDGIWRDYFFDQNWKNRIDIRLEGNGTAARSMSISRGAADIFVPFDSLGQKENPQIVPLTFQWTASNKKTYVSIPKINAQGLQFEVSDEDLPDFFLFPANSTIPASENAARFSEISRKGLEKEFVSVFTKEFPWISDLNIEVLGGFPVIHAKMKEGNHKIPVNAVSGGINRTMGIMLALAARPESVILVDEIENGIYYRHKTAIWKAILELARTQNSQLFLTTHDEEWLNALIDASGDNLEDVAIWRLENGEAGERVLRQFSGSAFKAGIDFGGDVR